MKRRTHSWHVTGFYPNSRLEAPEHTIKPKKWTKEEKFFFCLVVFYVAYFGKGLLM